MHQSHYIQTLKQYTTITNKVKGRDAQVNARALLQKDQPRKVYNIITYDTI